MQVRDAQFLVSNTDYQACPPPDKPEYAFIGRSNVGKSSLINMLTSRRKLAKTSSTPGKTQLINHFLIDGSWYLVDLPGYGWAKVGKRIRGGWQQMTADYLKFRPNLLCVFMLIDIRHKPVKNDLDFMAWLAQEQIPFALTFTKADKLSASQGALHVADYEKELQKTWAELPLRFVTSAEHSTGRDDLLSFIYQVNQDFDPSLSTYSRLSK
ncbi:GTP-binding protein [Catalinimonas alkaloidigena]|uniref:Probable GTP-binding protein EngB n=1 Tax=Catalinimonas alkaloidigena TaxID=1075417 RepID=A0A1G8WKR4_9BACT|nr:ribosome biogenesis GTP-binding protein YihA/YsxC [Catalinimonas alkaloidigena]SDJ78717.1 GTP-binding protein [Catalinimonas alkaloidigena]